jgi:hypothetical protein
MQNLQSIDEIKERHNVLYEIVLKDGKNLLIESDKSRHFFEKVETLLNDIIALSATTNSFDAYQWLSDASMKWQVVFSSNFNRPKIIKISLPTENLLSQPQLIDRAFSEKEIDDYIKRHAEYTAFWRIRETGKQSTDEEMLRDHHLAEAFLISGILDGEISFASRISSNSYWRLEQEWLKEIKRLNAYFIWIRKGAKIDSIYELDDFYEASEHMRNMLVNPGIKAQVTEFEEATAYIEKHYLTLGGTIDLDKVETKMMISRKAYRIGDKMREMNRHTDDVKNWIDAETYVRMFYENIIQSVIKDDPENVLNVLKAFQFSKAVENRYHIINCFETALAIYFINPDTIQKLWNESANYPQPDSCVESIVNVSSWPAKFNIPKSLKDRFIFDDNKIVFKGVMSESQKSTLLTNLQEQSEKEEHVTALNELFIKSRLIHKKTTL